MRVEKGVQLQALDWGGADTPDTMVLITGLGDNAHVYDQFAFQFSDYFHVNGTAIWNADARGRLELYGSAAECFAATDPLGINLGRTRSSATKSDQGAAS